MCHKAQIGKHPKARFLVDEENFLLATSNSFSVSRQFSKINAAGYFFYITAGISTS